MRIAAPFLLIRPAQAPRGVHAQVDEGELGGWYMYFSANEFGDGPWEIQGDILFTVGHANITSGECVEGDDTSGESRAPTRRP